MKKSKKEEGIKEESEYCGSIEKSKNVIKYNNMMRHKNIVSSEKAVTLVALVVTILFSYDEKLKCSNSKGFLLATI